METDYISFITSQNVSIEIYTMQVSLYLCKIFAEVVKQKIIFLTIKTRQFVLFKRLDIISLRHLLNMDIIIYL